MDFRVDFMKLASILALFPKPLKPCVSLYVSTLSISIRAEIFSFVVRMITSVPSKIRQMAEFIRPLVEERLTKLEEFGETWDGAPVRWSFPSVRCRCHQLHGSTERYAHVADERGKGSREVT